MSQSLIQGCLWSSDWNHPLSRVLTVWKRFKNPQSQAKNDTGVPASVPMITKGGLEAVTRSLASEYAKEHIRFNAVAPGIVDTPMHANDPKDFLRTLSPMGTISSVSDIVDAVVYLTEARNFTGEVMHVDGGAHQGRW